VKTTTLHRSDFVQQNASNTKTNKFIVKAARRLEKRNSYELTDDLGSTVIVYPPRVD
jgi:hypothetical protein